MSATRRATWPRRCTRAGARQASAGLEGSATGAMAGKRTAPILGQRGGRPQGRWMGGDPATRGAMSGLPMTSQSRPPGLIQRYREELQVRHYARRTVSSYEQWLRRFLRFHRPRHPRQMG
ncbi:MAG: phage integrase N-terminal SAM-like domain-containing protein, partial [Cyanobium sp.]